MPGSNDDDLVVQVYEVLDHDMHDMSCCSKSLAAFVSVQEDEQKVGRAKISL